MPKIQVIAGSRITLEEGTRYIATRPIRKYKAENITVSIWVVGSNWFDGTPEVISESMSYDDADKFLAAFNDGPTSFHGRVW